VLGLTRSRGSTALWTGRCAPGFWSVLEQMSGEGLHVSYAKKKKRNHRHHHHHQQQQQPQPEKYGDEVALLRSQ